MTDSRTEICLTVDTEFNIAGAFANPATHRPVADPAVLCPVDGREHGLGFLLESFREYGVTATFFVEALQTAYFDDAVMGRFVDRIAGAGFDVQLHIHPCWLRFLDSNWHASRVPVDDSCAHRSNRELDQFLAMGLAVFSRWGLLRPVATRTGNFMVDTAVHRALARAGIPISSSVCRAIFRPVEPALQLTGGRHRIEGTLEVPALSYTDLAFAGWRRERLLAVTASSWPEMRSLLWQARRAGILPIVIVTHPFEFIKWRNGSFENAVRNRVSQERLLKLLAFLRTHDADFVAVSMAGRKDAWLAADACDMPRLAVPAVRTLLRMLENGVNDRIWSY